MVGRTHEQAELRALLDSATGARLAWVQGRHGVGKTFLLLNAWPAAVRIFHHAAAFTTPGQNRQALHRELTGASGGAVRPTLANVLAPAVQLARATPTVVILDNAVFLTDGSAASARALAGELAEVVAQTPANAKLLVVLCGGTPEMLQVMSGPDAPLHGHFDWICDLAGLDYWSTAQLAPYTSPRDRTVLHAVFGSAPQYVSHLRPSGGMTENIARLCLARHGAVRQTVESALLREPGIRDHATYHAMLRAMGAGCQTVAEIHRASGVAERAAGVQRQASDTAASSFAKEPQGRDLTATRAKLDRLVSLGYVRRERNFGARATQAFRYVIDESAFAFHYTFVPRYEVLLERMDPRAVYDQHVAPEFDRFVTARLGELVRQGYTRLQPIRRLPAAAEWGSWVGRPPRGRGLGDTAGELSPADAPAAAPPRIELIARLEDGRVMTGGVHWHTEPVGAAAFVRHLETLRRLAAAGEAWAALALQPDAPVLWVSSAGFREDFARAIATTHKESILLPLDALFRK